MSKLRDDLGQWMAEVDRGGRPRTDSKLFQSVVERLAKPLKKKVKVKPKKSEDKP